MFATAAPNEAHCRSLLPDTAPLRAIVIQFTLIDELGETFNFKAEDGSGEPGSQPPRTAIPGGLGARQKAHLVATRWVIGGPSASCQSRVIHNFSQGVSCGVWVISNPFTPPPPHLTRLSFAVPL